MNVILNNSAESSDDDADGKADVEDEPDLPVGVAIKRLRKVFKVHACCSYTYCPMLGNLDSGIAEIFARGIRGSWALESEIQVKESGIPSPTDKKSGIQSLKSGIYDLESRIQECLGFSYMERYFHPSPIFK